jgi:hypothetical protein
MVSSPGGTSIAGIAVFSSRMRVAHEVPKLAALTCALEVQGATQVVLGALLAGNSIDPDLSIKSISCGFNCRPATFLDWVVCAIASGITGSKS